MAIEPLGSVMSLQTQMNATQKPQPAVRPTQAAETNAQSAERVDNATVVVDNIQGKSQGGSTPEQNAEQSNEQMRKAVEQLNKSMSHSEAVFGIHEKTNRVTIKIIDKDTKEVIKELPPEKTLDMIAKVWELAGLLVDERR